MKIIDINDSERDCKSAILDPDYPGFMKVQFKRHHEWMTIDEFLNKNPNLKKLTNKASIPAQDVAGIVSSSGSNFLRDSSQKWSENCYAEFFVWISRGKGEGQKRTVTRNGPNILHINKEWDVKPNKSSQYVISHNIHEVIARDNTLPEEDMKQYEKKAEKLRKYRERKPEPNQYNPKKKKKLPF